jgi:hypothetical protein
LTVATAAYKTANYLLREPNNVPNAWGPFSWNSQWGTAPTHPVYYLYWDIDLASTLVTRGYTPFSLISSTSAPSNPSVSQHWFDLTNFVMKVWDGTFWEQKIRVFAGSIDTASNQISYQPFGSQVGITSGTNVYDSGYIILDNNLNPVKAADGTFYNTQSPLLFNSGVYSPPTQIEAQTISLVADEAIPEYSCCAILSTGRVGLASSGDVTREPVGIVDTTALPGDDVRIIPTGFVTSDLWNWNLALGVGLYCGLSGELLQSSTYNGTPLKRIGTIISPSTILATITPNVNTDNIVTETVGEIANEVTASVISTLSQTSGADDIGFDPNYEYNGTSLGSIVQGLYQTVKTVAGAANQIIITPSSDGTSLTFSLAPGIIQNGSLSVTGQLIGGGTKTNDDAASGIIGEHVSASIASTAAVALTSGVVGNVVSITLSAGDWDVSGTLAATMTQTSGQTLIVNYCGGGTSLQSATSPSSDYKINWAAGHTGAFATDFSWTVPMRRVSANTNTTVYLVAVSAFTGGTVSAYGKIRARRVR